MTLHSCEDNSAGAIGNMAVNSKRGCQFSSVKTIEKIKFKIELGTGHENTEGVQRYKTTLSLTLAIVGVGEQPNASTD